jgi:hypothetical protein
VPIEDTTRSKISASNVSAAKPNQLRISDYGSPSLAVTIPVIPATLSQVSPAVISDSEEPSNPAFRVTIPNTAAVGAAGSLGVEARTIPEITSTVFSYDSTIYDTEITGSGICSGYPVILGTFPLTNLFKGDVPTNLGSIYEIQNDLRDSTVTKANDIVNQYYLSLGSVLSDGSPTAPEVIASRRNENLSKYNTVSKALIEIGSLKEQIIDTTKITTPTDSELLSVSIDSATTVAEPRNVLGPAGPSAFSFSFTSSDTGDFGNMSVDYVDDDVSKYNSSNKDIYSQMVDRFIGKKIGPAGSEFERNSQIKTTRQYQILKAALFQITQGIRLNDIDEFGYLNPYDDVDAFTVAKLQDFTSDRISMNSNLSFAKSSIAKVAEFYSASNNYNEIEQAAIDNNISYGNSLAFKFGYAIRNDAATTEFIRQIPVFLAYEIMEVSGFSQLESLPVSIRPGREDAGRISAFLPDDLVNITINQTTEDSIRFVETSEGQILSLFDSFISSNVNESNIYSPIEDILIKKLEDLALIKSGIDEIAGSLSRFPSENRAVITNQCALTVLRAFYDYFGHAINVSLCSDSPSELDTLRMIMFGLASKNDENALMLLSKIMNENPESDLFRSRDDIFNESDGYDKFTFSTGFVKDSKSDFTKTRTGTGDQIQKNQAKSEIDFGKGDNYEDTFSNIFASSGILGIFDGILGVLETKYPAISTSESLRRKIKISAFTMFLYFIRKLRLRIALSYNESNNRFRGSIEWFRSSAAFLVESLRGAFENTQASDLDFEYYQIITGESPEQSDIDIGQESFFKFARSPVKFSLQVSQDLISLIAYQLTTLNSQVSAIRQIENQISIIAGQYGGDSDRASRIAGRYLTPESIVELLYRSQRYQTLIPGTSISTIATRSQNYRSIIEAVFKDRIPERSDLQVCIVGIPYGLLERLRLAQSERKFYFGVDLFADDVSAETDENKIDYQFKYIESAKNNRPDTGGPFNSLIVGMYDDFESNARPSDLSDNSIGYLVSNSGLSSLSTLFRSEMTENQRSIDYSSAVVQAALQSYLEDVYGLYVRYATTKTPMSRDYPELITANEILIAAGYGTEDADRALEYARLRSMIMMHRDFITTTMLDDLESSPLFDKIVYVLYEGKNVGNVLTEFYARINS